MPLIERAALLVLCVAACTALHEEDVGRWNWHRENFGAVSTVGFSNDARRAYVATKRGLLGCVSAKHGGVVWRRVLAESSAVVAVRESGNMVIGVVEDGRVTVISTDGVLVWESVVPGFAEGTTVLGVTDEKEDLWPSVVTMSRARDVVTVVPIKIDGSDFDWEPPVSLDLPASDLARACSVSAKGVLHCSTTRPDASGALRILTATLSFPMARQASGSPWTESTVAVPAEQLANTEAFAIASGEDSAFVLSQRIGNTAAGASCIGSSDANRHWKAPVCLAITGAFDTDRWELPESASSKLTGAVDEDRFGAVVAGWDTAGPKAGKAVFLTEIGALVGTSAGRVAWVRDDGLGAVDQAEPIEVAHAPKDAAPDAVSDEMLAKIHSSPLLAYEELIKRQLTQVVNLPATIVQQAQDIFDFVAGEPARRSESTTASGDFGLSRWFVLKSVSAVYCVTSEGGSVVWQLAAAALVPGEHRGHALRVVKVLKSGSSDADTPPHVFVLVRDATAGRDFVAQLGLGGDVKGVRALEKTIARAAVLPAVTYRDEHSASDFQAIILIADDDHVFVHPEAAAASGAGLSGVGSHVFAHIVDHSTGRLLGYELDLSGAVGELKLKLAWQVQIVAAEHERIVGSSLGAGSPYNYIITDGIKVHGNASMAGKNQVLRRYVNPNAVLVVTAVPPGVSKSEEDSGTKRDGYLVFYLVDGVTGAMLGSMIQPNAVAPVRILPVENLYLMHFFNTKRRRYQISVWELFEDTDVHKGMTAESTTNMKLLYSALFGMNEGKTFSSYESAPPKIIPSAFTFSVGARALAATVSERGVASKYLIAALTTDEVVSIDLTRHLLANMNDGISTMSWAPTSVISYNSTVLLSDKILTFPTKLESTSLMLVLGNDIYFTRVTAGKPFDMLNEDFGYIPLVLTVASVTLVTFVSAALSSRKQLTMQWS
ncbi:ER membrane protein complex subunit 1 [Diplonema papillatum]|nr:ER membrane protein complex subunit 1 [Diplonema papillatum]|eukprot:gene1812-2765_t